MAVIAHHAELIPVGYIGVDVFFVLSGFLITALLLEERARTGTIRVRAFWMRRARRLLPGLLVLVAVVGGLGAIGAGQYWVTPQALLAALTFTTNWFLFTGEFTALTHTWSLGVEEQFYVTWPLIVLAATTRFRRERFLSVTITLVGLFTIWAAVLPYWSTPAHVAFGFDARVSPILMGCALAAWMHGRTLAAPPVWIIWLALAMLGSITVGLLPAFLTGLISTVLIWAISSRAEVPLLEGRLILWVGIRSYGIYLWHVPVLFVAIGAYKLQPVTAFAVGCALTAIAAGASYAFIERPFVARRRDKLPEFDLLAETTPR
jgi:peptidoglycan/LPS O-acetylase OafA/YrhL